MKKLFVEAIAKFLAGVLLTGALIFLPAGTLEYKNGWLLMIVLFVPMFVAGIVMLIKNPKLLERRLKTNEKQDEQRMVINSSGVMFVAGFVVAGLNCRFEWYMLPGWICRIAAVIFIVAYLFYAEVLRENSYLSRIVEVDEGQQLIDKGLYGVVRHPMYLSTLFLFLTIPIILGSLYSFVIFLAYPFIIVYRIINEERSLEKELEGYMEYKEKVKYRLIPFVW